MTASVTNLRKTFMLLAIAAALVTAVPALILSPPQLAQAQQGKAIEGRGTGQVNCPSPEGEPAESPPGDEGIFFDASKDRGTLSGESWAIFNEEGISAKFGEITGGHIGGNKFTLRGIESFDDICFSQTPATITITGQCGQGVLIQFRASNGQEGEFVGNVACTK
jgi:hypothetical protein